MTLAYRGTILELVRLATPEDFRNITGKAPTENDLGLIRYRELLVARYDSGLRIVNRHRILASGGPVELEAALADMYRRTAETAPERPASLAAVPSLPPSPRDRYRNDPLFMAAVDHMRQIIRSCTLTPSELREALMLAAVAEEMENPGPSTVRLQRFAFELIRDAGGRTTDGSSS